MYLGTDLTFESHGCEVLVGFSKSTEVPMAIASGFYTQDNAIGPAHASQELSNWVSESATTLFPRFSNLILEGYSFGKVDVEGCGSIRRPCTSHRPELFHMRIKEGDCLTAELCSPSGQMGIFLILFSLLSYLCWIFMNTLFSFLRKVTG